MDNLENGGSPDPQEAADVTAASGQSETIETQTPVEGETVDGGQPETTEVTGNPWDNDDRFKGKTAEEMYEIVREADKYKGQLSQKAKVADMLSQQYGLTPERMAQIVAEREARANAEQIKANPVAAVMNKVQQLEQQLQVKDEEIKLDKFLAEKPQYSEFREEIKNLGFTVDRDKTWDQIAEKYFGRAIVKGQETAYRQIDVKQRTQATGVSKGDVKPSITLDDMSRMSAAEMEAYLPKA